MYVIRPKMVRWSSDCGADAMEGSITVIESMEEPRKTGLIDRFGNTIYYQADPKIIGFGSRK